MNTKEKVLNYLLEAFTNNKDSKSDENDKNTKDDKTVSGEKLADLCGVSRAAIWKAVNALRA